MREYGRKDLVRVSGVLLGLLSLLVLLSTSSRLWGLCVPVFYLLGFGGFWVLLPTLLLLGIAYFLLGKAPGGESFGRYVGAYFLIFLGLSMALSMGLSGEVSFSNFGTIFDSGNPTSLIASCLSDSSIFPVTPGLGGGVLGYFLVSLFNLAGLYLSIIFCVLFFLLGLTVAFYPEIGMLIRSIRAKRLISSGEKSRKKEEREALEEAKKVEAELQQLYKRYLSEDDAKQALRENSLLEEEQREVFVTAELSRVKNNRNRLDNPAIPREIPLSEEERKPVHLSAATMATSGLTKARFMGGNLVAPSTPEHHQSSLSSAFYSGPKDVLNLKPQATPVAEEHKEELPQAQEITPQESAPLVEESAPIVEEPAREKPAFVFATDDEEDTPDFELVEEKAEEPLPEPEPIKEEEEDKGIIIAPPSRPVEEPKREEPAIIEPEEPKPEVKPAPQLPPYRLPPVSLLKDYPPSENEAKNASDAEARTQILNEAMVDLSIPAQVVGYTIGPSVTRYDVRADKSSSSGIVGRYVQDFAQRLGGVSVRFEQVVKGKSTSGLEIPNAVTSTVSFKEMLSSLPEDSDGTKNLYVPFGKSITGECKSANLAEFPHMLVSGTTGSGKSIFIHGMIMALLMRNRPEDVKFVLVDPKRVEMGKYKDLPHLLCPIVKEAKEAKVCLNKLADEMEKRYSMFEETGVSNIRQYNSDIVPYSGGKKMPFIIVVIDEFADLHITCKDIDEVIIRLTSKARAAGIHIILATQRPSADIVTGPIKANLGVKVALSVGRSLESRVILDQDGAEDLVGKGDMLVDCPMMDRNGVERLQACYVDNKEIMEVCNFIRRESVPDYDPDFLDLTDPAEKAREEAAATAMDRADLKAASDEELYQKVKAMVMARDYASTSLIQRQFAVGFSKAGRLFTRLQNEGVVASAPDTVSSSKGCRVLVHMNEE